MHYSAAFERWCVLPRAPSTYTVQRRAGSLPIPLSLYFSTLFHFPLSLSFPNLSSLPLTGKAELMASLKHTYKRLISSPLAFHERMCLPNGSLCASCMFCVLLIHKGGLCSDYGLFHSANIREFSCHEKISWANFNLFLFICFRFISLYNRANR